ncbi:ZIP family metal transporter [Patescibacteria group bacterium]
MDVINILLLATFGSIVALSGGVVFLYKKSWSNWLASYSVPFAAGVLLTVSLLGLLPEAVELAGNYAYLVVLMAFVGSYLFENLFFSIHHHEKDCKNCKHIGSSIPLIIIGDTVHNFIDGVVIAASYLINPGLGVITAVSTFLHEVPHEIGDFGILLNAGWSRSKTFYVNLFSASTTILGALLVVYFVSSPQIIGILMSIAAGLFLYLGASDFLPHIHEEDITPKKAMISLLLGVFIMAFVVSIVPHGHDTENSKGDELVNHEEDS